MGTKLICGSIFDRFRWISSYKYPEHPSLLLIDKKMQKFYQEDIIGQEYHRYFEKINLSWDNFPIHQAVIEMIRPRDIVVEFSCGSGHAFNHFIKTACNYYGFDLSIGELAKTKRNVNHINLAVGNAYHTPFATSSADVAISLYSLEHTIWPNRYLDEMIRITRNGGYLALAFPEYISNKKEINFMASMIFGKYPGRIKDKIKKGHWFDALITYIERYIIYRYLIYRVKRKIYKRNMIVFLINTAPLCLVTKYTTDNDAVYFSNEEEVARYITLKKCKIIKRSGDIQDAPEGDALIIAQVIKND
ncbi:MAG: class I SAM-dependent methyltransferase [Thermodesulfobacteriota bacterium]